MLGWDESDHILSMKDKLIESDPSADKAGSRPSNIELKSSSAPGGESGKDGRARSDIDSGKAQVERLKSLAKPQFYKQEDWSEQLFEILFKIKQRDTTVQSELYYGLIHFISCAYCLPVIPQQLKNAGYGSRTTIVAVCLCSGVGSILAGLFSNLPFVLAPPTVVSIFLSVYLQEKSEGPHAGSLATIFSGVFLILLGWRPLGKLVAHMIPKSIQAGTAIGIGLLTALSGSSEIDLVEKGNYVILRMGKITPEICIAFAGVIFICIAMHHHWKGSFCVAIVGCSLIWWIYENDFPKSIVDDPSIDAFKQESGENKSDIAFLTADLLFLYVLYLNGLMTSLSNLATLTRDDSTIPRGRWIYVMCGLMTMVAGFMSSAPILISPESAAAIKEGAKTGLSTVFSGVLFLIAMFFSPIFEKVPPSGTAPVLIMIGVILFQNVSRIDWRNVTNAAPAFVVLFYIPFTYSVIQGVLLGYVVYLTVSLFTGELAENTLITLQTFCPSLGERFARMFNLKNKQDALANQDANSMAASEGDKRERPEEDQLALFNLDTNMDNGHENEATSSSEPVNDVGIFG